MQITSRENENIKQFVKLLESKKHRDQSRQFTIEGTIIILEAHQNGVEIEKIFVTDEFLKKHGDLKELENIKTYIISQAIANKISQVKTPQGIFAIAKKLDKTLYTDTIIDGGNFLSLCSISDPGNIGTIIRTADALGIDGIILHNSCDIFSPKVIRATMGSLFRVKFAIVDDIIGLTNRLNDQGVATYATVIDENATSLSDCNFKAANVIYIGNEGQGLDNSIINTCSNKITIKMKGNAQSLNAAVACGITMWEITK